MSTPLRSLRTTWRRLRTRVSLLRVGRAGPGVDLGDGVLLASPERISLGEGSSIGRGAALRANTKVSPGITLSPRVSLKDGVILNANTGRITIGERSWLGPYCVIYGNGGVDIGRDVMIAAHTLITSVGHEHESLDVPMMHQPLRLAPVRIEDDVWIGARCTLLPGITVGRGAIVGAGSVVTRDVAPWAIVGGVPARVVGQRGNRRAA
jgi:acetyltransferase-like isoleucine patch superfamily enzyme